jgi:hypothetical protein
MATEIQAPHAVPADKFRIFLAGTIDMGESRDWQTMVVDALADYDVVLTNPRRSDWDSSWEQSKDDKNFREQVEWEQDNLASSDFRIFNFEETSKSPITFEELGAHINEPGAVGCPQGFYRKGNVDIVCERAGMPVFETLEALIEHVKEILDGKGLGPKGGKDAKTASAAGCDWRNTGTRSVRLADFEDEYSDYTTLLFQFTESSMYIGTAFGDNPEIDWDKTVPVRYMPTTQAMDQVIGWGMSGDDGDDRGEPHVEHLAKLMQEGTNLPPAVTDKDNMIIDGRHRIHAAHRLGLKQIPYIQITSTLIPPEPPTGSAKEAAIAEPEADVNTEESENSAESKPATLTVTDTPAFRAWFRNSLVKDANGNPLVVYRGEHGESNEEFHSRDSAISFGDAGTASLYAESPNHQGDKPVRPRVYACYLRIENPILNTLDEPFINFSDVATQLGEDVAMKFALKHSDGVEETGMWQEGWSSEFDSVEEMLTTRPEMLHEIYMFAFPLLGDNEFIAAAKAKGFDGAIHEGYGENSGEVEYKIFDKSQAKSAIGNNGEFSATNHSITAAAEMAALPVTDTLAFKAWFGASKMVDADGNPRTFHHGTPYTFDTFAASERGSYGSGMYFAPDKDTAQMFAEGGHVVSVYLKMTNPMMVTADPEPGDELDFDCYAVPFIREIFGAKAPRVLQRSMDSDGLFGVDVAKKVQSLGYDGLIVTYLDGSQEFVVYNANQVKSADANNGEFSTDNHSITAGKTAAFFTVDEMRERGRKYMASPEFKAALEEVAPGKSFSELNGEELDRFNFVTRKNASAEKWYHGTSAASAASIEAAGEIVPGKKQNSGGPAPQENAVYVTTDLVIAENYAGEDGVVFEVQLDSGDAHLIPDEDSLGELIEGGELNGNDHYFAEVFDMFWTCSGGDPNWKGDRREAVQDLASPMKRPMYFRYLKTLAISLAKQKPEIAKQIIRESGKAAHIGPVKIARGTNAKTGDWHTEEDLTSPFADAPDKTWVKQRWLKVDESGPNFMKLFTLTTPLHKLTADAETKTFRPDQVKVSQKMVTAKGVDYFLAHPEQLDTTSEKEPAIVARTKSGLWLLDGNHRATAAAILGRTFSAKCLDLTHTHLASAAPEADVDREQAWAEYVASKEAGKKEWLGLALAPFMMAHPGNTQPTQQQPTTQPTSFTQRIDQLPKGYKSDDLEDRRSEDKPTLAENVEGGVDEVIGKVKDDYHDSFDKTSPEKLQEELNHAVDPPQKTSRLLQPYKTAAVLDGAGKEKRAKFAGATPKISSPEELEHLKFYLNMTEEEKGEELARSFNYYWVEFIQNEHSDLEEFLPEDEDDYTEDFTPFMSVLPQFLEEYGPKVMQEDPAMAPSFLHMSYESDVKSEWLIHFTDHADAVAKGGFTVGMEDIRNLGLTTYFTETAKSGGGYNFAFTVAEFARYYEPGHYGRHCVVFQAPGIKVWHYGDEERQVIFWGKDAKNIIAVNDGDEGWEVADKQGNVLQADSDIRTVVQWVTQNWQLCLGAAKPKVPAKKKKLPVAAKLLQKRVIALSVAR